MEWGCMCVMMCCTSFMLRRIILLNYPASSRWKLFRLCSDLTKADIRRWVPEGGCWGYTAFFSMFYFPKLLTGKNSCIYLPRLPCNEVKLFSDRTDDGIIWSVSIGELAPCLGDAHACACVFTHNIKKITSNGPLQLIAIYIFLARVSRWGIGVELRRRQGNETPFHSPRRLFV